MLTWGEPYCLATLWLADSLSLRGCSCCVQVIAGDTTPHSPCYATCH